MCTIGTAVDMIRTVLSRALQSLSVRCVPRLGLRTTAASQAPFSSAAADRPTSSSEKVYELRTYSIQPARYGEFLKLSSEQLHMRTAHSKLIGYWTTELGGLNEVVHLWEYDNFAHRTAVRQALAQDKEWIEKYFSKILPMLTSQQNVVLNAFPWYPLNLEPKKYGAYELVIHTLKPGTMPQLEHRLLQGLQDRLDMNYFPPLGFWFSEFGPLSTVYHIWPHESLDKRVEHRRELFQNEVWKETHRDTLQFFDSMYVKALAPTPFSPLQ